MSKTILLTSFATWKSEQRSNSSDDLLLEMLNIYPRQEGLHFLRQLPVDFELAPQQAIALTEQLDPDVVLLCGMAEKHTKLKLESRAMVEDGTLTTQYNLEELILGLTYTEISNDAGRFVCNALYYAMLKYLQNQDTQRRCLFVHVPVLTYDNRAMILADFQLILHRLRITN
jgi:pyroglutamyl-peptidase